MCEYKIKCPSCGVSLLAKPKIAGRMLACPKCDGELVVPDPPALTEPAAVPSVPAEPQPLPPKPRPATAKQKAFARELGVDFPDDIDRVAISEMIDQALIRREDERYRRMYELGDKESHVREELRAEVLAECDEEDPRLSVATKEQIMEGLARRDIGAVLLSFEYGVLSGLEDLVGEKLSLSFTDDIDADDASNIMTWTCAWLANQRKKRGNPGR